MGDLCLRENMSTKNIDEIIVIAMPFLFSAISLVFGSMVPTYATFLLKVSGPLGVTPRLKEEAVKLATAVYVQLGFVFAVLSSSVSCIALTVRSPRPIFAAVGAFFLVTSLLLWVFKWQHLKLDDIGTRRSFGMTVVKWSAVIVTCTVTFIARYYPSTGS